MASSTLPLLHATNVIKRFGGLTALDDVELRCESGEVVGLIGPNGSGKSTLINVIGGRYRADSGRISLNGSDVGRLSPDRRARLGLRRTFQQPMIFRGMTVQESLELAAGTDEKVGGGSVPAWALDVPAILDLCGLRGVARLQCDHLPQGRERLLGIALALSRPCRVLLLDEPAAGTTAGEGETIRRTIGTLRRLGVGVIVVDHHMDFLMQIVDRIVVLNHGTELAQGTPSEIRRNPHVIDVYLGRTNHAQD